MSPCNICIEEECKGKHNCHCETCQIRPKCYRHLHATIRITNKCTQNCQHCCFESSPNSNIMMTFEMAQDIAKFIKNNDVHYLNLMGGEFFCNPDWYNIFRVLIDATTYARIVSNGDWANVNSVKTKLLKLKDEFEGKFKISISNDKWHTNTNVEKAEEFLKEKNFLYNVACEGEMSNDGIVPVGRAMFEYSFYSMFSCYCHNPEKKYGFLIDEDGDIFKCEFGMLAYANIKEYIDGGFDVRFKEYNQNFYKCFIPSCASCSRYFTYLPKEKKEEYGRKIMVKRD